MKEVMLWIVKIIMLSVLVLEKGNEISLQSNFANQTYHINNRLPRTHVISDSVSSLMLHYKNSFICI